MKPISENAEQEDLGNGVKQTVFYAKKMFLQDGKRWVGHKEINLSGLDKRLLLPGDNWIESKRTQARFLIGKGSEARFNLDVKMEALGGGNKKYALNSETVSTKPGTKFEATWEYSHKEGPTTHPGVFKMVLLDSEFSFIFQAPVAGSYRLFLQVTPVIGGVLSSGLMLNKTGQIYGASWRTAAANLYYTFPDMAPDINAIATNLTGNTLFLYSRDFTLAAEEGFTLG